MNGVDVARFEFDFDTTWAAFFLDADLNVYSRYGGRDEKSPDARHSPGSLLQTMREVLQLHQSRVRLPPDQRDRREVHPPPPGPRLPEEMPLLRQNHGGCLHCHQVREYGLLQAYHDGTFSRQMIFPYPLPESLGLDIDRDHGHRAGGVRADTAARRAGVQPGDEIVRVNDVPVRSELDLRWALHRAAEHEPLRMVILRTVPDQQERVVETLTLRPDEGWKRSKVGWRKSLRSVPVPWGFLAYHVGREERKAQGLPESGLLIRVVSIRGEGLASNLSLRKADFIVEVNGNSSEMTIDEFKSILLETSQPGSTVRLGVLRDGKRLELTGPFPRWHTTETAVP